MNSSRFTSISINTTYHHQLSRSIPTPAPPSTFIPVRLIVMSSNPTAREEHRLRHPNQPQPSFSDRALYRSSSNSAAHSDSPVRVTVKQPLKDDGGRAKRGGSVVPPLARWFVEYATICDCLMGVWIGISLTVWGAPPWSSASQTPQNY